MCIALCSSTLRLCRKLITSDVHFQMVAAFTEPESQLNMSTSVMYGTMYIQPSACTWKVNVHFKQKCSQT